MFFIIKERKRYVKFALHQIKSAINFVFSKESLTFALSLSETYFGAKRKRIALCAEYETLYTDEVTDIEEFLENSIIKVLVLVWTNLVAGDINLDSSL